MVIAGGGPVGAALALALRASTLRVALIEARPLSGAADDARTIALAHGSRLILERLGVWQALARAATPITDIHVSQQGRYGRAHLSAAAAGVPAAAAVPGVYTLTVGTPVDTVAAWKKYCVVPFTDRLGMLPAVALYAQATSASSVGT